MSRTLLPALALWLLAVNLIAFTVFGIDKRRAKRQAWRVPERVLFLPAFLGGGLGAVCGMCVFHHKTLHPRFRYGLPAILLAQLAALCLLRI